MDTIHYTGDSTTALPDYRSLGTGALRLYELVKDADLTDQSNVLMSVPEVAEIILECSDEEGAENDFTNYSAWPCEDVGAKKAVSGHRFLSFVSEHGYKNIRVSVVRLLSHASVLAEVDRSEKVENSHLNRVLCAYYSSFDARSQAMFYPASYSRFASTEACSFEFSSFVSEFISKMMMPTLTLTSLWLWLNMGGWKSPSLVCDFFEKIGDKPRANLWKADGSTASDVIGGNAMSDALDDVVNGIISPSEYIGRAETSLLAPYSHLCQNMSANADVCEMIFDVIALECPTPASVGDVVDAIFEHMEHKMESNGAYDEFRYYETIRRKWGEYCNSVSIAYEKAKAGRNRKNRTMPIVCVGDDSALLFSSILTSGLGTVGEAICAMGYGDASDASSSLFGRLPVNGDVDFVRSVIAYAACMKSRYLDDEYVEVNAEDIVFTYRTLSSCDDTIDDEGHNVMESFISFLDSNDFAVSEDVLYRVSDNGSVTITAQSVFDAMSDYDEAMLDTIAVPLNETDYSIDDSAIRLFGGAYILCEEKSLSRDAFGADIKEYRRDYYESLMTVCSLSATQFEGDDEVATLHDVFFAAMHEPTFDPSCIRVHATSAASVGHKSKVFGSLQSPVQTDLIPRRTRQQTYQETAKTRTPYLDTYCDDMTAKVREGLGEGIVGREDVISKIETVLLRKDKSNPVLLAPAGSGKTAIVEGIAKSIADGTSQAPGKRVVALNIGALVDNANANIVAERISGIVNEAISTNTILFIDEIHMITSIGQRDFDVANMLKPFLARSGLKVIGATTEKEYNATISKDRALDRRFDAVRVPAMDFDGVVKVLEAKQTMYGSFHGVVYEKSAIKNIALMAQDYMSTRTSPDRELDILDASAAVAQKANCRVVEEQHIVDAVKILTSNNNVMSRRQMARNAHDGSLMSADAFSEIAGQERAKKKVLNRLAESRIALSASKRPANVMMFVGDSGVGKTYMARQMANVMNLGEDDILEIALGDFQSKGSHTTLLGAPPSYVGYDDGGVLVNFATAHPSGIVILDEIDKCTSEITNIFLGIFDTGVVRAANGLTIDCSSMTFICTANTGFGTEKKHAIGFGFGDEAEVEQDNVLEMVKQVFGAPLVSRMDEVIMFDSLSRSDFEDVCKISYDKIAKDVLARYDMELNDVITFESLLESLDDCLKDKKADARVIGRKCEAVLSEALFEKLSEIR